MKEAIRPEAVIAELAARQHGVVSRSQLLAAGLPVHVVEYRVRTRQLVSVYRGVYRAAPIPGPRFGEMAAVLASGTGSVLSHWSAAALWDYRPGNASAPVDVYVRGRTPARIPGIRSRAGEGLEPDEVTTRDGIPVTTPLRTLVDLAGVADSRQLERAVARAERAGMVNRAALQSLLARRPARKGAAALRALLAVDGGPALTRSEAEAELLSLVRQAPIPAPETNVRVAGHEVDFLWRAERLVLEVDGFAHHSSRAAFERDRRRDAALTVAGYRVIRVTWRQIEREPIATIVTVAWALAIAGR